jgi:4a-hydroxytetrahydrobiopterin dehydratase
MTRLLDDEEITRQLADLPDWRRFGGSLHARYQAPDFPTAVQLVSDVADTAESMNHHPDIDIRWRSLRFVLSTHSAGGLTQLDMELAHQISAEAARAGARSTGVTPSTIDVAIDAVDAAAIVPFWRAGLAYEDKPRDDGRAALRDPAGLRPYVWFQQMDPPRTDRNRIHLDVNVPRDEAQQRVEQVLGAGGRLVTDEHAPGWWVLADSEGNELCVCSE